LLTEHAYSSARTLLVSCVIALKIEYYRCSLGYRREIHPKLR